MDKDEELKPKLHKDDYYPNTDLSIWLRTCHSEVKEPLPGNVTFGKIPVWLTGSLIRNGPGGVDIYGEGSCKHLFDAPGLLQKFHIQNGIVTYSSRYIETRSFQRNVAAKRLVLSEFGTVATPDPCQTIFARIAAVFLGPLENTLSDTANISIHPFGDEIYSLAETPFAHRIDIDSLETTETVNVHNELGIINHSAHPHICGRKVYNIGQKLGIWLGPHYIIAEMNTKISSISSRNKRRSTSINSSASTSTTNLSITEDNLDGTLNSEKSQSPNKTNQSPWSSVKIIATVPSRWPLSLCYMHTFSITQSYFILIEQPLSIFLPTVPLNQIYGDKPIASCLKFYPEEDTIFHVISRHSSSNKSRKTFRTKSLFFLHTINAFEMRDDDSGDIFVVVDICSYDDASMIDCMYVDALKNAHSNPDYAKMFRGRPKRFLLKLNEFDKAVKGQTMPGVESETIVDIGCETPRINELFDGKPYNYFYAISSDVDLENPGTLIKVDVLKKNYETWSEPKAYPSEPIFIPRPAAVSQREDDGIVISTVVYGAEDISGPNRTTLIILDARTWDLIAKVDFLSESGIPKCLHGWFFPDKNQPSPLVYSSRERRISRQNSKT